MGGESPDGEGRRRSTAARGLSTARAALRALAFLEAHPEGVGAGQVGKLLGRSLSTAYYVLTSLCQEGFAIHRSDTSLYYPAAAAPRERESMSHPSASALRGLGEALEELYERTGMRTYLGLIESRRLVVADVRGRQGLPTLKGVGPEIHAEAHATALGKVVLSHLTRSELDAYVRTTGLRAFSHATITDPAALVIDVTRARRRGVAVDREEYAPGFSCLAAPVYGSDGTLTAVLALSATARQFRVKAPELARSLTEIAATASAELSSGPAAAPSA